MTLNRRFVLGAGLGLGTASVVVRAANAAEFATGLSPDENRDQTALLQSAIDAAAENDAPLILPPGKFVVSDLRLRQGTRLIGAAGATTIAFAGGPAFVTADKADGLRLEGIAFDARYKPIDASRGDGAVTITRSKNIELVDLHIAECASIGLSLIECSGRVTTSSITDVLDAAIKSLDSLGLDISANRIDNCGNNGILVWRSSAGEDGSVITANRISRIRNSAGGTGEYGNGVNVFRAGGVIVSNNRITDCTFTAVRGNAASNIQIIANSCERLGEVALYSEFGFEGALIANNIVDGAAAGISVTNFNDGGRLAVIQGNLIRNLFRREHEREDKRGEGIGVEADAVVTGNTIENAPTVGIQIGWGSFMRDITATGNVIRKCRVGITVTSASDAGTCLIANNLISAAAEGAIRQSHFGTLIGPDLAKEPSPEARIQLSGNLAV